MSTDLSTMPGPTTRRQAILGTLALASQVLVARVARSRGRLALGGKLSMRVPWPVAAMDPHRLDDAASLLFGSAVFESLYAASSAGAPLSVLAHGPPEESPSGARVVLRQGVRFASGRPLTPRDVVSSLSRSRSLGGHAWLDGLGTMRVSGPDSVLFGARSSSAVAQILASPLAAIVPDGFNAERPDGTGPFAVGHEVGTLMLVRNRFAASGPAFLDAVRVASAPDLAASLRAFESGEDDVGWLGLGLHEPRRGAIAFDAGTLGWAVLSTGEQAQRWNAPGVAQRLADGIDPSRLAQLGIRDTRLVESADGWGGPPAGLLVRADSPWLVELGRALAAALTRPAHEVTVQPIPPADLAAARASRAYALALDVTRPFDPSPLGIRLGLAAAEDPVRALDLARHPPRGGGSVDPRILGRLSRVGVVAEIHFQGGHMPELALPLRVDGTGIDFGAIVAPRSSVL